MSFVEILLVLLFLGVSAFLSLSEIALVGISKIRLRHMVEKGVPSARNVQGLVTQLDEVITLILVGSGFANAALTSIVTAACILWLGETRGVVAASIAAAFVILLFAEILPKIYAARSAESVSLKVALPMQILIRVFRPISRSISWVARFLFRTIGVRLPSRSPLITEEELKLMIEVGKEQGVLGEHERMMLHRIFEFGDLKVKDVMVPLSQTVAVSQTASHDEVLTILTEEGHSRIPVYRESRDRIVGVIYAQEILHIWREGWLIALQDLIHPPFEVSPERRVLELLQEFQKRRVQMAVVADAQGKALGIVTLEDLVEEIVGEIRES